MIALRSYTLKPVRRYIDTNWWLFTTRGQATLHRLLKTLQCYKNSNDCLHLYWTSWSKLIYTKLLLDSTWTSNTCWNETISNFFY